MSSTPRTALVLGATGGIGGETARALLAAGWNVCAMARRDIASNDGLHWIRGDAMNASDVLKAAAGCEVIVHAVNPPGYRNWAGQVLPMIDNTIAAARAVNARIVLPGTIYNYGADAFPVLHEDSPQHPATRKGGIRVELERRLEVASRDGVRSLILRCGDFFGPRAGSSWLSQGLVKPGKPLAAVTYPGPSSCRHAWAYLPDVAATVVRLLDDETRLDTFARFHFAGHTLTGDEMVAAIRRAAHRPHLPMRRFSWLLVTLASPFVETLRELKEMRYLWETSIELDGVRLHGALGQVPSTPIDEALRDTLTALGCL